MIFFPPFISTLKKNYLKFIRFIFYLVLIISFISCSSAKRFTSSNNINLPESNIIRVLLSDISVETKIQINSEILISYRDNHIAKVKPGNVLLFQIENHLVKLSIQDKVFRADSFILKSFDERSVMKLDNKSYRGMIKVYTDGLQIKIVNHIGLEDYVKGVMTKEMPVGKENENYGALKAFSICVRTYALLKVQERKSFFDIYPDTRDQVYGGVDAETEYTNRIVDETRGQILTYNSLPAVIFFHSTCGGYTEDVENVFTSNVLPYLKSIKDGNEPYCSIAPKFSWKEEYSEELFIQRLFDAKKIISKNYKLISAIIKSRFNSGRVNELFIKLEGNKGEESISLFGNNIRNVLRTSDGKSILRSTMFSIDISEDKSVIIAGKGYGHGVGLCQWGAIGQSKKGIDYQQILNHYFPGTKIIQNYD